MMEVERAAEMGFCFGVRRAIDVVEKASRKRGPLQTLGALVHNQQVVSRLAEHGVGVANSLDEVEFGVVAIASHGVRPEIMEETRARGLEVIDATCPFVRKAQVVARKLGQSGLWVLVFGDSAHPEVQGVLGWAGQNASASLEATQLDGLPDRLGILCQTTQNHGHFARFVAQIVGAEVARFSELRIFNTICDATRRHQAAALELAKRVDLMLVIGGQDSANTRRLAEISGATGVTTCHIETAAGVEPRWLQGPRRVGITAGTSTPDSVIDEVVRVLGEMTGMAR
jgi:4-hydroxy-3-methylbut-2-enyl diphosphate reductase